MMIRLSDMAGWLLIAGLFYAGSVFTCALDDSCAALFMGPLF